MRDEPAVPVAATRQSAAKSPSSHRRFPKRRHALLLVIVCGLIAALARYSIPWWKVAGGGGTSTGGGFTATGTLGQPDASGPMTNGQFTVTGSFWATPTVVQTPDAPSLHITHAAPGFATIWWTPPTPGFVLQSTDSLSPTNWVNAPSGPNNPATVPLTVPNRYYRLIKP